MSDNQPENNPFDPPVQVVQQPQAPVYEHAGDSTGGLIPYKNPAALTAYYLGLFSLLPVIGLFLAVPAVILGVKGLKARSANPEIKGSVHAWIGIVLGSLFTIIWGLAVVLTIIGIVAANAA